MHTRAASIEARMAVMGSIREHPAQTFAEIVESTGLSESTVRSALSTLKRFGEAREVYVPGARLRCPATGRPSRRRSS